MDAKAEWTELFDRVSMDLREDNLPDANLWPARRAAVLAAIGHDLDRMSDLCGGMDGAAALRRVVLTNNLRDTHARLVSSDVTPEEKDGKPLGFWSTSRLQVAEIAGHIVFRWHRLTTPGNHGVAMAVTESRPLTYWRVRVWCTCCGDLFGSRS